MAAFARFVVPAPRRERHFRHINGLDLEMSNTELRRRYRFSRESIKYISNLIKEDVERKTRRNHARTVDQQVLVTLRFLASGSFLQVIGDTLGMVIIRCCTRHSQHHLTLVHFPTTSTLTCKNMNCQKKCVRRIYYYYYYYILHGYAHRQYIPWVNMTVFYYLFEVVSVSYSPCGFLHPIKCYKMMFMT